MTARKPNELKRIQGNPGKSKLPNLAVVASIPQVGEVPPAHLSEKSQELWTDVRALAPWIATSDSSALVLLLEKLDRRAELIAKLQASDPVLYTDKGYAYANPIVGMLSTIETEITKLFSLLGLTPTDRSRLGVAEVKKVSIIDQLSQKYHQG